MSTAHHMGQTSLLILDKPSPELDEHLSHLPKNAEILAFGQDEASVSGRVPSDGLMVSAACQESAAVAFQTRRVAAGLSEEQLKSVKGVLTRGGGPPTQLLQVHTEAELYICGSAMISGLKESSC